MYFSIKKNQILIFVIILNSIYFQAIQTAVSNEKNMYKKFRPNFFMVLDHGVSCDQNKSDSLGKTDYLKVASKSW